MGKTTNRFSPEARERAVRLVLDGKGQRGSCWRAILSVATKIGRSANTLDDWIRKAKIGSGLRAGIRPTWPRG